MIISKLSQGLSKELALADEIWIAVALLNTGGLNYIRSGLKSACREHYIVGIDLPSHPDALSELYRLRYKDGFEAAVATRQAYFHPKLYLIRKKRTYVAFIGSANCTGGGLENNVELSFRIEEQKACRDIRSWFEGQNSLASPITRQFLKQYREGYSLRQKHRQQERLYAKSQKEALGREVSVHISDRKRLVSMLRLYKRLPGHKDVVAERKQSVGELRRLLDYPHFRPGKIMIDDFFKIHALGHILSIPKPTIIREIDRFSAQLRHLCDESADLPERYNRAMRGDLEIRGVKEGLLSKILTLHDPEAYFVENSMTMAALTKYGIELPKGLTDGQRYKAITKAMREVCHEAGLENMAVLDYYLYSEGIQ